MTTLGRLIATAAVALAPSFAGAACLVQGEGEVNVLMNFFPTTQVLDAAMKACERDGLVVSNKLSPDHKTELVQAFSAGSSPFDAAHVTNSSITQLQSKALVMPLNALVEKYRDAYQIEPGMEIRFGDDIMAIAFMANAQVFYYRKDLFEKHGIEVPKTYDDILAAAEKLKGDPDIQFPFGAAYASGWELGNDFLDILLGKGGQLVDPMTNEAAFNGPEGVATLELMQKLATYMSPNALTIDFGGVKGQLQQGQVAMAFLWGDLASSMDNPSESKVVGKIGFAAAPASAAGGPAATLFWWDGFAIPKNLDGDPEVTFQVLMEALRPEVVAANNDVTLWLRSNYQPSQYAAPITDSVNSGAPPYPMTTTAELAHAALGEAIGNAIAGKVSAQEALDAAAKAYRQSAVDAGLLK
jgi:ABC-type glycerol-3-phosphate transport system substrate-binding protein